MKVTKPYWYPNIAYLREPYFVCLHFPNLIKTQQCPTLFPPTDLPVYISQPRRRVSSVVEHSSTNPKVPGSIPGPVSHWGDGL